MRDFQVDVLSSTDVVIKLKHLVKDNDSATLLKITAIPLDPTLPKHSWLRKNSSNRAHFNSLRPFSLYKFILSEVGSNTQLANIGPVRTWPSGSLLSVC